MTTQAEKDNEHWMQTLWRPAMGWLYMLVCFCDFVAFPVLWSLFQAFIRLHETGAMQVTQWNPITLQGAGFFHISMGAILGISAFGRTQEKLGGVTTPPMMPSTQTITTPVATPVAPAVTPVPVVRPTPTAINSKSAVPTSTQPEL